ncbi:MAG: hypothetical protein MAG431_02529 [Chloroflexi bacterium]|nr:hypothetical protein [Chloroflexota bacterium]
MTRKKLTWPALLSTFSFLIFLFLGIRVGETFFLPSASAQTHQERLSPARTDTEEPILLLIYVDDLNKKKPSLEGVWLANFQNQQSSLLFFPLLPSQAKDGARRDKKLTSTFSLNDENQPSRDFFEILSERNVSWQGYMLIDQWAAIEIINFMGEINLSESLKNGTIAISELHPRSQDRLLAQHDQAQLLLGTCRKASEISLETAFSQFLTALPQHLATDGASPDFWERKWLAMKAAGKITCQTPTLPNLR